MALCEHSCDPNTALLHDGDDLWFCVLRDITAGEAITTSYLDLEGLFLPVRLRRKRLHEAWQFTCTCARCLGELTAAGQGPRSLPNFGVVNALVERCRELPGEEESERVAYCASLNELGCVAFELHGTTQPTAQSLLLRAAIFAPDGAPQEEACRAHLEACEWLHGQNSELVSSARLLLEDPAAFLREAISMAGSPISDDSGGGLPVGMSIAQADDAVARAALRDMYRQHLHARVWPRCRAPALGGRFVASEVKG